MAQGLCTLGLRFRHAFLPATIDAMRLGHCDSGCLPFPPIFPLDLRQPKQDTGDHPVDRTTQVNLLGHGDDTDMTGTPIRQDIDPILLTTQQPIELPYHDGRDRPSINGVLQPHKRRPSQGVAPLDIFKPLDGRQGYTLLLEPVGDLGIWLSVFWHRDETRQ